jgi:two-component system, NarL family, nitrate/nitrite response regulator NarL
MREQPIRILLADNHPLMCEGIAASLDQIEEFELVGQAHNSSEAVELTIELQPDVLLLDLCILGLNPFKTMAVLRQHCPQTNALVFSAFCNAPVVQALVEVGIAGYVVKEESGQQLHEAIRTVASGVSWFSPCTQEALLRKIGLKSGLQLGAALTKREREVCLLITEGLSNKEIACLLQVKEKTVEYHVSNSLRKLGLRSRVEISTWVYSLGSPGTGQTQGNFQDRPGDFPS